MEHGELGTFLLAFAAALLGAKVFGELAERIGQPAVLGELFVGILLGPSLLGLVPLSAGILLVAEIGVLLLLFEVGLETDLEELARVGGAAMAVAVVGMVVPFASGYLVTRAAGYPTLTAIFVGAALTATSIGITSRVLSELAMLKSREGQIILGAAVADDILGLVVLAVVSQIAATGSVALGDAAKAAGLSFGFLLIAIVGGIPLGRILVKVVGKAQVRGILVAVAVASRSSPPSARRPRGRRRSSGRSRPVSCSRGPTAAATSRPRSARSSTFSRPSSSSRSGRRSTWPT